MTLMQQPTEYLQAIKPKTVADIVISQSPSILRVCSTSIERKVDGKMQTVRGETVAKALLVKVITDLISFFNIGKMMNGAQVASTVELMIEAYGQYKIDDFVLCFKRAKLGYYGQVYDRIDGNVIFDWFEKYIEERNAEFEAARAKEKRLIDMELDQISEPVEMPEKMKELLNDLKNKKTDLTAPKILTQTEQQKQIQDWMYDFDEIWEKQGSEGGKRTISISVELTEKEREAILARIEEDYLLNQKNRPEQADRLMNEAISKVGIKRMDISEYLNYRANFSELTPCKSAIKTVN
ncbi:MAG: hypothetical protein K0S09_45 [Sphingobacteriaceae bacterium]|jgi:hypothetical protein|nr:hypothetical protein [Sphingobacteriaceae bacterium]